MKTANLLLTLALLTGLPGCGPLVMTYRNVTDWSCRQWSAEKAWHVRRWMYADMPCRGSFKAGFKAGYRFACGGYDSCEPPQYRHYWRYGGLTNSERENAQAWSDGFTHGTVAAQQDHSAAPSALDAATMQPPPGVPDVRYNVPPQVPNEFGQDGGYQYEPPTQMPGMQGPPMQGPPMQGPPMQGVPMQGPGIEAPPMPGYQYPGAYGQNFQPGPSQYGTTYVPAPNAYQQYVPAPVPMPAPASEAMPAREPLSQPGPMPGMQPGFAPVPAPAPASVSAVDARYLQGAMIASEGSPGMPGQPIPGGLQPAPPAEPASEFVAQRQFASPAQTTQAVDWELPLIRN